MICAAGLAALLLEFIPGTSFDLERFQSGLPEEELRKVIDARQCLWNGSGFGLGWSTSERKPVSSVVMKPFFCVTLPVVVGALLVQTLVSIAAGLLLAAGDRQWWGPPLAWLLRVWTAIPGWLAASLVLLLIPTYTLLWTDDELRGHAARLALPVLVIGLAEAGPLARVARGLALEILGRPHVQAARARGIGGGRLMLGHVLPALWVPAVSVAGLELSGLVISTMLVEVQLNVDGFSSKIFQAYSVSNQDVHLAATTVLFLAALVAIGTRSATAVAERQSREALGE